METPTNFANRSRLSFQEACEVIAKPSNTISHMLDNGDRSYSVMSHIVCEHCDYCDEENRGIHLHAAKADPYEIVHQREMNDEVKDFFSVFRKYKLWETLKSLRDQKAIIIPEGDWCAMSNAQCALGLNTQRTFSDENKSFYEDDEVIGVDPDTNKFLNRNGIFWVTKASYEANPTNPERWIRVFPVYI